MFMWVINKILGFLWAEDFEDQIYLEYTQRKGKQQLFQVQGNIFLHNLTVYYHSFLAIYGTPKGHMHY